MSYTIVVGTDGSPAAEHAVMAAADLAAAHADSTVHVVTAVDTVPIEIPVSLLPMVADDWARATKEVSNTAIERTKELMSERGVSVTTHILSGEPAKCLQQVCEDTGADLLVVGKHGSRRSRHFLIGSTAERCVRHATCSVLVVTFGNET
jgi:nucleotide-binding universal stress UspA family protein